MERRSSLDSLALRAWADTSSDGVVIVDRVGRLDLINVSAQELLMLETNPASANDLIALVEPAVAGVRAMLSLDFTTETSRWGSVRVPKYPSRLLSWERVPLYDGGQIVGLLLVIKVPTATFPIERANQSFLSMISHDLRTPLSAILGFAELLRQNKGGLSSDEQSEFLDHIIKNANDLSQYTQIALDIMYLEANLQQFEIEAVALDPFIMHWMADARYRLPDRRLIYHGGDGNEPRTQISPAALHRILQIVVEFALQEGAPEGTVEIWLEYEPERAHVVIEHVAPALKPSEVASLFELMAGRDLSGEGRPRLHRLQLYVASLLAERQRGSLVMRGQGDCHYQIELILPCAAPA